MSEHPDASRENIGRSITIAHAQPHDAEGILTMKRATWLETYVNEEHGITPEDIYKKFPDSTMPESITNWQRGIASEQPDGQRFTFVAKDGDKVVGFTTPNNEEGRYRPGAMYVAPEAQGKGIGGKLMKAALDWIGPEHDVYLDVVDYNQKAIDFYSHFGFVPTGKTMPMYVDEDGIKHLPQIEMVRRSRSLSGTTS